MVQPFTGQRPFFTTTQAACHLTSGDVRFKQRCRKQRIWAGDCPVDPMRNVSLVTATPSQTCNDPFWREADIG